MKTKQIITVGLMAMACVATAQVRSDAAQETKVRVKKIEIVNGVEKTTDTTYTVKGPININNLNQLQGSGIPPLPNLQEHLIITENNSNEESINSTEKKNIIIVTDEIVGNNFDSVVVDNQLNSDIQRALKAAGVDGQTLKVDKTVCVTNSKEGNSFNHRSEKIIVIKTSKVYDANAEELKVLGLTTIDQNKLLNASNMQISPNPSTGRFNLKFELLSQGDTQISVLSPEGKTVYNESLKNFKGLFNKEIALGNQTAGIYFIKVQQNQKIAVKKLIIE